MQTFFFYSVNHLSSQRHDFTHKCFSSLFTALYLLEMTFFSLLGQNTNMLCRMPGDGLSFFLRRLASVRLFSSVLTNRAACVDICGSVRDRSITDNRIWPLWSLHSSVLVNRFPQRLRIFAIFVLKCFYGRGENSISSRKHSTSCMEVSFRKYLHRKNVKEGLRCIVREKDVNEPVRVDTDDGGNEKLQVTE